MSVAMLAAVLLGRLVVVTVKGHGSRIDPAQQRSSLFEYGYPGAVQNGDSRRLIVVESVNGTSRSFS